MKRKKGRRAKHIPQRTCVGCRQVSSKRGLIRLVTGTQGFEIDLTGKMPGRGVYLHRKRDCWDSAFKNRISSGLKTELTEEDFKKIHSFMKTIEFEPDELNLNGEEDEL